MKKKWKIMLFGPTISNIEAAYGGGTGGYTRKMTLYLNYFDSQNFEFVPCFHTVRGELKSWFFVTRYLVDMYRFLRTFTVMKPEIIHVLAQYRKAIFREWSVVLLAALYGVPVVYEIKAGAFISWHKSTINLNRIMANYCIRRSKKVLCQGKSYIKFIKELLDIDAHYHPNVVPTQDIPTVNAVKLQGAKIRILFVGYAFKDKGVFELIDACIMAAKEIKIELTFAGKEHRDFTRYLDKLDLNDDQLLINRLGLLPNDKVLELYQKNDIYLYPTYHAGEGHNNTINEAMMTEMIIITTTAGFMNDILDDNTAYLLREVSAEEIYRNIVYIYKNREKSIQKARKARSYLIENFTTEIAFSNLETYYSEIVSG